jgi:hypothetical protein
MNPAWTGAIGAIIAALLGGGIVKAFVDFLRDRRTGNLEEQAFEYKTLSEMNSQLRSDLKDLRAELEDDRRKRSVELDEERTKRRQLEDELALERRKRAALEIRVAELENTRGDQTKEEPDGS